MFAKKNAVLVLFLLIVILTACNSPIPMPLPTSIPVAELPTVTATSLPPTTDLTAVSTPFPTAVPATRPPTATPIPATAFVGITSPEEGDDIVLGSDVIIRGLAELGENSVISVTLTSLNGRLSGPNPGRHPGPNLGSGADHSQHRQRGRLFANHDSG